jgi:hypothetical protein
MAGKIKLEFKMQKKKKKKDSLNIWNKKITWDLHQSFLYLALEIGKLIFRLLLSRLN